MTGLRVPVAVVASCVLLGSRVAAAEPERSGVTFGLGMGSGAIVGTGYGAVAAMRAGWAVSSNLALLVDYGAVLRSSSSAEAVEVRNRELLRGCVQYWPVSGLFLRGGLGVARVDDATDDEPVSPAYAAGLGYELASGRHAVFDVSIEHGGWLWRDELQSDFFVLLGFSYY